MSPALSIALLALAGVSGVTALILWALARSAAALDRRDADAAGRMIDTDQFTPSMDRFGYVQDARNQGDL